MPRHLAIDVNVVAGLVRFNGTQTATVLFTNKDGDPVKFKRKPRVSLTLLDPTSYIPYRVSDQRDGNGDYIGFTIGFQAAVSLSVEWQASER